MQSRTRGKIKALLSKKRKRIASVVTLIIGGWFGEYSFFVSFCRSLVYNIRARGLQAVPKYQEMSLWYGLSWKVHFSPQAPIALIVIGFSLLLETL